jgi:hypothetical protein
MAVPRSLNRAQAIFTKLVMNTTATIYRRSTVSDTSGGGTDSYAVILTNVPCAYFRSLVTPRENENTITVQTLVFWNFVFPAGTTILATDRIVSDGRTFEVTSSASGSMEVAKRVFCTEIT